MQVANLVLPWFASTTALELLAGAFESAASLCDQYVVHFYQQCAFEAGQGPKPDGAPSPALHSKVAWPLGKLSTGNLTPVIQLRRGNSSNMPVRPCRCPARTAQAFSWLHSRAACLGLTNPQTSSSCHV